MTGDETITTSTANLSKEDGTYRVHGIALGEGDRTRGKYGLKAWPREVLEPATASLEGQPVWFNDPDPSTHGENERRKIGEIVDAGYEPGKGVVYDAELTDEEVAGDLSTGDYEVSIEASNPDRVEHDDKGAAILHGFEFTGMAVVEQGASPSNYTAPGQATDNPGIAALAAGSLESDQPDDPDMGEVSEDSDANEPAEPGADSDTDTMSEETTETEPEESGPDVEALLERVDEKEERIESLEAELEQKEEEIKEVKQSYAAALAEDTAVFEEDDLVSKFSVAELREKFEAREDAELAATEPEVQTGGGSEDETEEETAELEADPEAIKKRHAALKGAGMRDRAAELAAEYEEATGETLN